MKTKIFEANDTDRLEQMQNDWFKEIGKINVCYINQSSTDQSIIISIYYEPLN